MENIRKNRLLFWILIFLVVVNIAALVSFFLMPGSSTGISCDGKPCTMDQAYREELGLTKDQLQRAEVINQEYRESSGPLAEMIRLKRGEIIDQLSSNSPDTVRLEEYSEELSLLQRKLHQENMRHYLSLKQICDHDQAFRLSNLYRELYGCPMQGQGQGMQHRHRHGQNSKF